MFIVLDRDGVINFDSHEYIKSPDEWIPISGSLDAIAKLKQAGHTIVIATNQSGIARGLYTHDILSDIHDKMSQQLAEVGASIDGVFYCPHHPDEQCICRKPEPGLFYQIAEQFDVHWPDAVMVGDSLRDIQAAAAVGCPGVLVRTGNGAHFEAAGVGLDEVTIVNDLLDFANSQTKR